MRKRIISVILVIAIIVSSFALSITAYGSSQQLKLNVKCSATINGAYDKEWFYYTPDAPGVYSLLSYNTPTCECYLFVMETNEETGLKEMKNLAYSKSDPNYAENGHSSSQFCLTYHLDEGVTYYYAAGWLNSETRTSGSMTVMLRNDSYDQDLIESIELSNVPTLDAYSDGSWYYDADGVQYFRYDISKVIANVKVTINFVDGTSISDIGAEKINGYTVYYKENQFEEHWYPQDNENYTANTFTVNILNKSASIDVPIESKSKYYVKGKVVDTLGNPVANAKIYIASVALGTSNSDGIFSFYMGSGKFNFTIKSPTSIDKPISMTIVAVAGKNDYTDTPIEVCNCDVVKDGIINAKDYAEILKETDTQQREWWLSEFSTHINFTSSDY